MPLAQPPRRPLLVARGPAVIAAGGLSSAPRLLSARVLALALSPSPPPPRARRARAPCARAPRALALARAPRARAPRARAPRARARRQPLADRAAPATAPRRTRRVASRATPLALPLALPLAAPLALPHRRYTAGGTFGGGIQEPLATSRLGSDGVLLGAMGELHERPPIRLHDPIHCGAGPCRFWVWAAPEQFW